MNGNFLYQDGKVVISKSNVKLSFFMN